MAKIPTYESRVPMTTEVPAELTSPGQAGIVGEAMAKAGEQMTKLSEAIYKIRSDQQEAQAVLEGKKIFLIEDSIVRGTTCKTLIQYLKEKGGAKEVHIRVSAPIIFFPCFYGIDMSTMDELIANRLLSGKDIINRMENAPMEEYDEKTVEKIRKELKADSLIYQTVDDLIKAIGKPKKDLCTACLTGDYPTEYGKVLVKKALQERGCKIRTYE